MADSTERLVFDIFARDRDASRTFKKVGDSADKAGDDIKGMGKSATNLDRDIDKTRDHLRGLIAEFERTGDVDIFKAIRKDRSTLGLLESMRKELGQVVPEAEKAGKAAGKDFSSGFSDAIGSLPLQAQGALMVGLTAVVVASAPIWGSMIGGAVLGGVGAGGIIGGIALAAQSPLVADAAKGVGQRFVEGLTAEAEQSFTKPLIAALDPLERAGNNLTDTLGKGFRDLAPTIADLAHGVEGFSRAIGPGLSKAFKAAEPAVRLIGRELPRVGDAISDALSSIADNSDGAIMGLSALFDVVEVGIRATGELVGWLSSTFEWLVKTEGAALDFAAKLPILSGSLSPVFKKGAEGAQELQKSLNDAKSGGDSFVGTLLDLVHGTDSSADATIRARDALVEWAKTTQDQFDPMANFMHRLDDVKKAQQDYTQAVKEHGPKSDEAKDANLRMAEAILAANSAAATASGTFDGHFPESLKATLRAGHMTEKQINDLEKAARDARAALLKYEDVYTAKVKLEFYEYRAGERNPSGKKAMGGPVVSGRSYLVGENGPEIVEMGGNGYVHNASQTRSMLSGASGGSAQPMAVQAPTARIVIDVTGGDEDFKRLIRKMVRVEGGGNVQVAFGG